MNEIPREFDWVMARSKCSLRQVFEELKIGIESDCQIFNKAYQLNEQTEYRVNGNTTGDIWGVMSSGYQNQRLVKFYLRKDKIDVVNEVTSETFVLMLTLNDEGRCKLKIEGEELEQWQVRRRILEGLFFG